MHRVLMALIVALSTGCYTCYHPTDPCVSINLPTTGFMVVNNCGAKIDLVQDGQVIAKGLEPGQVMPLRPVWLRTTAVVAVGYTPTGEYVGSDSYIFNSSVRETWTITRLVRPQTPSW